VRLPLLLALPHAGLSVPDELVSYNRLDAAAIAADGDGGAREIYGPLEGHVEALVTTQVARAFVDLNRAEDDRHRDGVVKTHTCWDVPVYDRELPEALVAELLERYHRPYHRRLSELGRSGRFLLGVDCHTMAAFGPPVGPDPGAPRPRVNPGDGAGACPAPLFACFVQCLNEAFGAACVVANQPFRGGYTVRHHGREMPWVQLELSRAEDLDVEQKRRAVLRALETFCERWPAEAHP